MQTIPTVSICIPSRNTRLYLEARRDSVIHQTFSDFEVVIVDDRSTDGSVSFFLDWASKDPRVRFYNGPGEGLYPGWNHAIQSARGKYIYVATSDDTMAPNCLEELVNSLEANPDCGIAHCKLRAFAVDDPPDVENDWWRTRSSFARSVDGHVDLPHVRRAPGDGLYHACGESLFVSVTQLLIRKSVFDQIGYYSDKWGSLGDFEWAVRAGFSVDTVYVPSTWGGWRMHSNQATAQSRMTGLAQLRLNRLVFESVLRDRLDSPAIADLAIMLRECQSYVDERQELRSLIGCSLAAKITGSLDFKAPSARVLRDAALHKIGFPSRWRVEDARLFADCIAASMKWIDYEGCANK